MHLAPSKDLRGDSWKYVHFSCRFSNEISFYDFWLYFHISVNSRQCDVERVFELTGGACCESFVCLAHRENERMWTITRTFPSKTLYKKRFIISFSKWWQNSVWGNSNSDHWYVQTRTLNTLTATRRAKLKNFNSIFNSIPHTLCGKKAPNLSLFESVQPTVLFSQHILQS